MALQKTCEERTLLPESSTATVITSGVDIYTNSDTDDEEDSLERDYDPANAGNIKLKLLSTLRSSKRRRYQIHRGARRIARLLLCALVVPVLFLMLYLPLYSNVPTRHVALSSWGYETSRNIADYVVENDTTILEPRNICRHKIFVLIVVCSGLENFAARQIIRDSWGNTAEFNYGMFSKMHAHLKGHYLEPTKTRLKFYSEFLSLAENQTEIPAVMPVRVVFLVGRSKDDDSLIGKDNIARLRSESEQYNDIIQENFIDTYNNLTLKSVMALKWVTRRCLNQSAFFMKCDDDTFVNIPNLLHFLLGGTVPLYNDTLEFYDVRTYQTLSPRSRMNSTSNYLVGHLFCTVHPVADVRSKWYMPYYMYPKDMYPKYLSGSGYLMTIDVVQRLYETALNTTLVYLEDVYVTGLCADKMRLRRRHHPLFYYTREADYCSFKGTITQHGMKYNSNGLAYAFVSNTSNQCPSPGKYFKRIRLRKNSCE